MNAMDMWEGEKKYQCTGLAWLFGTPKSLTQNIFVDKQSSVISTRPCTETAEN